MLRFGMVAAAAWGFYLRIFKCRSGGGGGMDLHFFLLVPGVDRCEDGV